MIRAALAALLLALPLPALAQHPTCKVEGPTPGRIMLAEEPASPEVRPQYPLFRYDPAVRIVRRPMLCPPLAAERSQARRRR